MGTFEIDPDIRRAETPPSALYFDPAWYRAVTERVMTRSWHVVPFEQPPPQPESMMPWVLLPGCLDEPVLWTRDAGGTLRLLSNVCTHRGKLLVDRPCSATGMRCSYHGRRFALDGRMLAAPEFDDALAFPRPVDHLRELAVEHAPPLWFAGLDPAIPATTLLAPLRERLGFLPWTHARFDAGRSRDYFVEASWALYCDNYLEGFHIPFVHPSLARALDYRSYRTELLPHGVLQIGVASDAEHAFELPADHVDAGQRIGGYYFFLFPTTMVNVYPWGLSINAVQPVGPERCRVVYLTFVWDPTLLDRGAGSGLDQVEFEDERVVESVARGVRARSYDRGRYSPSRETGTHHFHRLLAAMLA